MKPIKGERFDGYEGNLPVAHLAGGAVESLWQFEPEEARRWNKEGDLLVNLVQYPDGSVQLFLSHQRKTGE